RSMAARTDRLLRHIRGLVPPAPGDATDAELLGGFALRRDGDAFTSLVARHGPMVLGVCRRVLRHPDQAEDVARATFLVLARRAQSVRRPDRLAAWLHRTAHGLALNHLRGEARRRRREAIGCLSTPALSPSPLDELTVRELLAIFDEEVQRLPERY